MVESETTGSQLLAVDSHVHVYDWANFVPMLDSALRKFSKAVQDNGKNTTFSGILALTEPATRDTFSRLAFQLPDRESRCELSGSWHLEKTAEPLSLRAVHRDGTSVYIISGQQIVTREKLEVLSIFASQTVPDQLTLAETLAEIRARGGFPILPWGVGKWLFGRGKVVGQQIQEASRGQFGMGDNGGRPSFWKQVGQFELAKRHDLPILRGSDPLPVSELRRTGGSYGDLITCPFDPDQPGKSLCDALRENKYERTGYGPAETAANFFKDQIALRLKR